MYISKNRVLRVLCVCLICAFVMSSVATAEPYASNYIESYIAYPYADGHGTVTFYFSITGDTKMTDIGATRIDVYESSDGQSNWHHAKTYQSQYISSMMGHNVIQHNSEIKHRGTIGKYYRADVTFYAGRNGGGDTRYYTTSTILAK